MPVVQKDRNEPLRVAVAGFGIAGAGFHAPLIASTHGLELAAIMTRSPERAAKAAAAHPGARIVDQLDALMDGAGILVVRRVRAAHRA